MERWFVKNKKHDFREVSRYNKISDIVAKLLVNRDITDKEDIDRFLNPSLDRLASIEPMKGVVKGAEIILKNIEDGNKMRIVGDFDVDGVMSVYILYRGLKTIGAQVDYVIPDRVMDGYGINDDIVREAKNDGIHTIITCDNGIAAIQQISLAKELGLTVIVTDHHDIPYEEKDGEKVYISSDADVIINPKQMDCPYPTKNMCGAGICYRFIEYLLGRTNIENISDNLLEFAAIATICDVVDLIGENRIIVKNGIQALNKTKNIGLKALIDTCGLLEKELGVYHIGFVIGPTINASGRLDSAMKALELLLTDDVVMAYEISKDLRQLNEERKSMTTEGIERIIKQIEDKKYDKYKVFVVYEPMIHESIAGIIAGRIKERYNKPTIVLTKGQEGIKGSGRSIEEYNMFEELSKCKDILGRFGGHPMAAGLSLEEKNIDELRSRLNSFTTLKDEDLIPKVYIDMELPIEYISARIIEDIKILEPYGKGNSKPLFGSKKLLIQKASLLGANKNTIKLIMLNSNNQKIEGILFKGTDRFMEEIKTKYGEEELKKVLMGIENNIYIDIIYYPDVNEFKGNITLQAVIQNYRFS